MFKGLKKKILVTGGLGFIGSHTSLKLLQKDYEIIIAAAGGAAHLAGVTAALTTIPVLGVPMPSVTNGVDSLYSTVQMPAGVPVATLAIGKAGAKNSALFAIAILSRKYPKISQKLKKYRSEFESNIPKRPY